jgi:hypothetical protein
MEVAAARRSVIADRFGGSRESERWTSAAGSAGALFFLDFLQAEAENE